ncbi:GNAT family N-acetyltransferase [Dinoroseobacter sp. S375]|uniref:GNAT family N-acetyltransferase n=1 Tax=Dinoroseobacter sp. S375 TaxID=3415136 RepID=UPI003C7E219B
MSDLHITRSDTDSKARYLATIDGLEGAGELTLSKASATLIVVDHTAVPDTMRGRGVANALARAVIADARAAGQKIVPLCPFFKAYVARHREDTADVIA